jgi:hypothetical protein
VPQPGSVCLCHDEPKSMGDWKSGRDNAEQMCEDARQKHMMLHDPKEH